MDIAWLSFSECTPSYWSIRSVTPWTVRGLSTRVPACIPDIVQLVSMGRGANLILVAILSSREVTYYTALLALIKHRPLRAAYKCRLMAYQNSYGHCMVVVQWVHRGATNNFFLQNAICNKCGSVFWTHFHKILNSWWTGSNPTALHLLWCPRRTKMNYSWTSLQRPPWGHNNCMAVVERFQLE